MSGLLKDLTKMIPGYGGYVELESRREDDRLTREFLVSRLQDCKKKMDGLAEAAISQGDLDAPSQIDKMRGPLDLAQSRLRAALEGYAGWFSEKKVDEELLKSIAELDANLVSLVDQVDSLLSDVEAFSQVNQADLKEAADLLNQRIDRRTEMLRAGS